MNKSISISAPITATTVKRTQLPDGARELLVRDPVLKGFGLRVYGSGARYIFKGRVKGTSTRRTVVIGDAWAMTVKAAREAAECLRIQFGQGIDPIEVKAAQARAEAAKLTLGAVADEYKAKFEGGKLPKQRRAPRPESVRSELKDVDRAVSMIGAGVAVEDIDPRRIRRFVGDLGDYAPSTRKKTFGCLSRVLVLAMTKEVLDSNPCAAVESPVGSEARERFLSEQEVAKVWDACGALGDYGRTVRFLIAMPVRASIARGMTHDDVDVAKAILRVGADQQGNKARQAWSLPLNDLALEVIGTDAAGAFVFQGQGVPQIPLTSTAKARLDKLAGVTDWQLHDLRRTVASLLAEAITDVDTDAADQWLMHKRTGVKGVYQRGQRLAAMRLAANQWNSVLTRVIGRDTSVVPLAKDTG
ncbi:tyrosine-type recombinase/integrase [Falsiruegeria litorea]|uniref:tyrosine-type recombinase/integrase n=1 Tax=Falsiruegeria litorea TaxID=1280831 RepID=UPI001BFE86BE|nr:integrase family protein [Falsiruegeria litorea]